MEYQLNPLRTYWTLNTEHRANAVHRLKWTWIHHNYDFRIRHFINFRFILILPFTQNLFSPFCFILQFFSPDRVFLVSCKLFQYIPLKKILTAATVICTMHNWLFVLSFYILVYYCDIRTQTHSSQSFPVSESKTCYPNHFIARFILSPNSF